MTGRHVFVMLVITIAAFWFNPLFGWIVAPFFGFVTWRWYVAEGKRMDQAVIDDVRKHRKRVRDFKKGVIDIPEE